LLLFSLFRIFLSRQKLKKCSNDAANTEITMRILVLGGAGFIGRHAVSALQCRGHSVVIGSRFSREDRTRVRVRFHETLTIGAWQSIIAGFDTVLNCVGILRKRLGESYDVVHHRAPTALAQACAAAKTRLVHVSALGLSAHASSRFLRSKFAGEQAIAASGADLSIVRPSLLDGVDGFGSSWLRRVADWPIQMVPADARGRIAALDVDELGEALAVLCEMRGSEAHREVELGGNAQVTLVELLKALRTVPTTPYLIRVPAIFVRMAAHVFDALHVTPLSWGHVELMRRDNCPRAALSKLSALLGRIPKTIDRRGNALLTT
jgi:uncharacterized protein YbjT (DUF2867 family)